MTSLDKAYVKLKLSWTLQLAFFSSRVILHVAQEEASVLSGLIDRSQTAFDIYV